MQLDSWKATMRQALAAGDQATVGCLPKTDLHCHALLSAPLSAYEQLAGHRLPPPPQMFGDFKNFLDYISTNLLPVLATPHGVGSIIRAALERMRNDGVVYTEMSFDLLIPEFVGLSHAEFADLIAAECARVADRLHVAPEIGVARGLPIDQVTPRVQAWLASGVFRGIDLYDDENLGIVSDFQPLYRLAAEHGLRLKAHAGELCGPERVRESVEILNVHAVQHGVRAVDDPAVVDLLVKRGTVLHMCPTSNRALGICPSFAEHPARRLFDSGVKITVNTDDFTLFGASATDEIFNLQAMGFSADEIVQIVENGLTEIPEGQAVRLLPRTGC